jgi:diguanylate cyclase (GGDEF)-like protein
MELQAVTAGAAAGIVRITIAFFMLGLYLTARRDPVTAYWALSAILVAIGTSTPLWGATMGEYAFWAASCCVVCGAVCWWWGLRLFFGHRIHPLGWWIMGLNALIVGAIYFLTGGQQPRLVAFAISILIGMALILRELWRGDGTPVNVGRGMVAFAFMATLASIISRSVYYLSSNVPVSPLSNDTPNVLLLYMIPTMSIILAAAGTVLIYLQRSVDEKERLASHDDLTGLFNRRAVAGAGREALTAGAVVLMVDVDNFKSVNDTLGHQGGDAVLRRIAEALAGACRRSDIIGRHGGEEFCVICPGASMAEAQSVADRLIAAVAAIPLPAGLQAPLSVSIGMSAGDASIPWDALVNRADRALYSAKSSGRSQVVMA